MTLYTATTLLQEALILVLSHIELVVKISMLMFKLPQLKYIYCDKQLQGAHQLHRSVKIILYCIM
jgi:hypothetical protein